MKTWLSLLSLLTLFAGSLSAQSIKIATVDMNELFEKYYKTADARAKLNTTVEEAQGDLAELQQQGQAMVEEFQGVLEQVENPALSETARQEARSRAEQMQQEIQIKQQEMQQFQQSTQSTLQRRMTSFRELMLEDIRQVVRLVAEEQGATLVLDTTQIENGQLNPVVYSAASWDITDQVLLRLNANAPATTTAQP